MANNEYLFNGTQSDGGESKLASDFVTIQKTITLQKPGAKRSNVQARSRSIELDDAQLLEVDIETEQGVVTLLMTLSELKSYDPSATSRAGGPLWLPTQISGAHESRGIVALAFKVLRLLDVNVPQKLLKFAVDKVEKQINSAGPGLYQVTEDGVLAEKSAPSGDEPILLLLHGTASSTENAFASLLPVNGDEARWKELYKEFDGRIFALEQKTLTQTPVENVLQFLDQWPADGGPPLVLLSHSRGGIVGDFLSSLHDWKDLPQNWGAELPPDAIEREQLFKLQSRMEQAEAAKRPIVQRHIRVGAPANGTSLASDKLHIWLSVLSNLIGFIPGVGSAVVSGIGDLAVAIAKEGLNSGTLPGIDAQKKDSPFIEFTRDLTCEQTDLLAVAGDSQSKLKSVVKVIFKGESNDLVVDTDSMKKGPKYKTQHTAPINDATIIHTTYFKNKTVKAHLYSALTGGSLAEIEAATRAKSSRGRAGSAHSTTGTNPAGEALTLSVTHGNLMFCESPVMVGHYLGDGIKRAELALDSALEQVLTKRWKLGAEFYAGVVGSNEVALRPAGADQKPGPVGAIVVGLGPMGELQKGDLITTVRNGVLKYAQTCAEQGQGCSALKISSMLIGSGQEALELFDVLDGTVQGVMLANKIQEASRPDGPPVRVTELEFIEWHLDMAIAARHELERLKEASSFRLNIDGGLGEKAGGQKRAYLRETADWWDSLKVEIVKKKKREFSPNSLTTMNFSVLGGKALGVSDSISFNRREIDTLLAPLLSSPDAPDSKQIESLFEQMVPAKLKPLAAQKRNLVVNMDVHSAYLPWEIMVDRKSTGSEPLAVAAGMVRRIIPGPDEAVSDTYVVHAEGNTALVIGNTPGGGDFVHLSGAYDESSELAASLIEGGWEVNAEHIYTEDQRKNRKDVQEVAAAIRRDILVGDYRVIHFAAHGIYDAEQPGNSGVVIGYDYVTETVELFGPHHVRAIRNKPSLVFINCCHTGGIEERGDDNWEFHKLSASLAAEFIKAGVHCVIGAGWAVDDAAALTFSQTVYDCLLNGESFGYAVRRARKMVYEDEQHRHTNTWAAFQCYGDPGFVLSRRASGSSSSRKREFFHISEMRCALENIRNDLAGSKGPGSSGNGPQKLSEANALFGAAENNKDPVSGQLWSEHGDILTHFAIIYCDLDEQEKALKYLKLAAEADCSDVPLADLLVVANYQARYAERRYANRPKDDATQKACADIVKATIKGLELHKRVHKSAKVHEHLGAAHKLQAMLSGDIKSRKAQLHKMKNEYEAAAELTTRDAHYPALNAILGYVLLRDGRSVTKTERNKLDQLRKQAEASLASIESNSFWDIISGLDKIFIFALDDATFDRAMAQEISAEIITTVKTYGNNGQLDSIIKQFRCVGVLSTSETVRDAAKCAVEKLKKAAK